MTFDKSQYKKLPLASLSTLNIGQKIQTFGWVENSRIQKNYTFIDLYAQYKILKCIGLSSTLPTVDITTSVKTITQDDEDIEQKLANLGITEDM
ncbi:putative asparagine--tRNA ligase, cytoplasmic, partial [Cucumispora dikerogammari]